MAPAPGFREISDRYELWRARRIPVIEADVQLKYARMAQSPWWLARGSYHRYVTQFAGLLPDLAGAPVAVSVGDLHVENFGTWRDRAGRLVWGVRGLDEVDLLPYTADLVRLAATAALAAADGRLGCPPDQVSPAILAGWSERIAARHPEPFVLGAAHADLYNAHAGALRDPVSFEAAVGELAPFERALPKPAARMLASVTPPGDFRVHFKRAETDSNCLGARRIIAVGTMDGGLLAREIKQLPGPVSMWAQPKRTQLSGLVSAIDAARGVAAEPWRRQSRKWVVRGLDGALTDLALPNPLIDPLALLAKMGAEAANLHLTEIAGAAARKAIRRDAGEREEGWLSRAAETVLAAAVSDHADWSAVMTERGVPAPVSERALESRTSARRR
jgi:hypothetical protein